MPTPDYVERAVAELHAIGVGRDRATVDLLNRAARAIVLCDRVRQWYSFVNVGATSDDRLLFCDINKVLSDLELADCR